MHCGTLSFTLLNIVLHHLLPYCHSDTFHYPIAHSEISVVVLLYTLCIPICTRRANLAVEKSPIVYSLLAVNINRAEEETEHLKNQQRFLLRPRPIHGGQIGLYKSGVTVPLKRPNRSQ
jgi:hypothetical protein